jgi:hypothetical protein
LTSSLLSRASVAFVALAGTCGCAGKVTAPSYAAAQEEALSFAFRSLDDKPADSESYRGKPLVVSFFSTGDLSSQAQTNFLVSMAGHDAGKVGYLLVAMEPPSQRELIELYRKALKVTFAVAIADERTLAGESKFGVIAALPTVVVLDAQGKVVMRAEGRVVPAKDLRETLRRLR